MGEFAKMMQEAEQQLLNPEVGKAAVPVICSKSQLKRLAEQAPNNSVLKDALLKAAEKKILGYK